MSKIIKKAFGDNSHYKLFRYPYDDTQVHEEDTINNEKIVIRWIGNDQEELYFYNNCLTKVKEIEPNLRVYQIDKNKDLVIGWKRKDEATPRVELTINGVRERVLTANNQEVTPSTILHIGDKIHFTSTTQSNIQRYNTEAHDPDSITWTKAKTITDYGEIQLKYQKVELISIDQDPKTPFTIVNNSKANIVITNPYDNNKVVHTGDAVFYKHNFFHATMNENYAFDPEGSHFIELVDKSANLYRITDNNPFFNIKYAGKVKIVIQDPSNYNAEYRVADGGLISNNDMMPVGSIIKIRLTRDNVDLKDMPEHTTLVSQTFWNTDDDPYDLRKDYNVKINEEEDLTTITLKPPQPTPSTVFKTNANKYNDKVTVESHINHVTADPLPSDPTWFSQFEVVKISFKGNYGETGYKIDSVQNAIHCGEDYYQANGAECIINISEVSDYKLRILKSAPGATAEECGVYDMEVQNKKYPDGAILSLNKIIRIIPQENFIIDQDRLADLELVDSNMSSYKVTGLNPTVATKVAPFVTVTNENPDQIVIRTTKYPQVTLSTYPDNTHVRLDNQITVDIDSPNRRSFKIIHSGLEYLNFSDYYKVIGMNVNVKTAPKKPPFQMKLSGPNIENAVYNDSISRGVENNDPVYEGERIMFKYPNGFTTLTEVVGLDVLSEHPGYRNTYTVKEDATEVKLTWIENSKAHLNNTTLQIIVVSTVETEDPEAITDFPENVLHIGEQFKVAYFYSVEHPENYEIKATNAKFLEVDENDGARIYKITGANPTVKAVPKPKNVTVYIPSSDDTKYTVLQADDTPITDGAILKSGQSFKIKMINKNYEYTSDSIIDCTLSSTSHYGDNIPIYTFTIKEDIVADSITIPPPTGGATVVDADNDIYKITAANVTIEAEPVPFITINNDNQDIVVVYTKPGNGGRITTFPCSDKVHQNQDIYVKYVNEATQKPVYDISVVGATANTEEYGYKAGVADITVSASRKVLSATIHINHAEHVTVKAADDNRELHDGDTSVNTTQFIAIVPKAHWHMKSALLRGLEVTSEENKFMVIDREVFIDVEEDQVVTINNLKKALLKVEVDSITLNTFPDSTHLHMDEEFVISFFNASLDPKYDLNVTGAAFITTVGHNHKYKATSSNVIVDAELKPVPATIHITGDANIDVTTVPGGVAIHDGDTSQFVGNKLKIVPKHGYKLKLPLTGVVVEDAANNIYKIMDENVTIEAVLIPFVTINNESTDLLKVVTASIPSEELTVFPCSDKVHEDENIIISFKLASNATKYDVVVTGATRVAGNIYKATTGNITVKAEAKFPPATIHIIDGDHVDVADATSGRVILDNDTLMFVGDTITVVPKSGYRLKQKVGLELLSKPSKLYKIANASVTIEVEEIPTPPAPPPGSLTHNTILWYLKSLFYGGV